VHWIDLNNVDILSVVLSGTTEVYWVETRYRLMAEPRIQLQTRPAHVTHMCCDGAGERERGCGCSSLGVSRHTVTQLCEKSDNIKCILLNLSPYFVAHVTRIRRYSLFIKLSGSSAAPGQ